MGMAMVTNSVSSFINWLCLIYIKIYDTQTNHKPDKYLPGMRLKMKLLITHVVSQSSRSLKLFPVLEHCIGVKELRYIYPYSPTSLRVVGFVEMFNQHYWAWEQTGFAGWKPLHHKLREQGLYISIELVRLFLEHSPCYQARIAKKSEVIGN